VTVSRVVLAATLLVTAAILQVVVVNPLDLPGGGPDLVLLVLIPLAMVQGPLSGAVTGFAAGLLVDLVPPAAGHVGSWALVLCLAGYLAGHVRYDSRRSAFLVLGVVAGLSVFVVVGHAALALLFGEADIGGEELVAVTVGTVLYDLLLAPFVVPPLMGLARRAEPDPSRLAL
jgi:rod shape-determining protein MreD